MDHRWTLWLSLLLSFWMLKLTRRRPLTTQKMETWFLIVATLCASALLKSLFDFFVSSSAAVKLPPGPATVPVVGNFLWLRRSMSDFEPILRNLCARYGPIITLRIGSRPAVFIRDRALAHRTLVQNGAVFADRPPPPAVSRVVTSNQHNISSAGYGPNWRLLRRNLTSEILHPSRVGSYSKARKWVLEILLGRLKSSRVSGGSVKVIDDFQYAMFCLLVLMCFGDKLEEKQIGEIESIQRRLLLGFNRFSILNFWPRVAKVLFRKRWLELLEVRQAQEKVYFPLIRARREMKQSKYEDRVNDEDEFVLSYVDTLLDLELPEDNRRITDEEIVSVCSEFLSAGTDTTSTALQWIMANLVKTPEIQEKLLAGIKTAMEGSETPEEVREEDLHNIPYLKAVVLEGLRRHPPGHFVLPHAVTRDVEVEGYVVPRKGSVNYMVAEMGWDPSAWEEPMEFRPERFMSPDGKRLEPFDVTGSKEIKMMPFGAGRRICPGYVLAMLHLEYFVANLVWNYEWKAVAGEEVDLSEKLEFTVVMKHPLNATISPRSK